MNNKIKQFKALTGDYAVAEAMRQINPEVVAAYPITPQSQIMEKFSQFVADGEVDTEFVSVESEHSAMSATIGASASGARAMTATSSQGLALMWEVCGAAAGLRLPIVMPVVNRALSAPINIHCDHSDSMGAKDLGWIQIYSETAQEAYEHTLLAVRLSEAVMLPTMIMQDGFITSHGVVNTQIYQDEKVKKFLGEYKSKYGLLDPGKPVTYGPIQLQDYYFETFSQRIDAMNEVFKIYPKISHELKKVTGNTYPYIEEYKIKDAEAVIVVLNSTAGTTKVVVDKLRKQGKKVGLLKIRLFRPFPYAEVGKALRKVKRVAVLDRSTSIGAEAPIFSEIKSSLYNMGINILLQSYLFGMGGRDIYEAEIEGVFGDLLKGKGSSEMRYIGLRK
ncbi:pyruvate ferredoxin oxidoreductase [Patescibacteria group bacterium]|nr:pyruvate ferredoxin oxidoreductase [Patescibacteria group bacterium]